MGIEQLSQEETVISKVRANELLCVGAFYEISSGIVDFFSEITVSKDDAAGPGLTRGVSSRHEANGAAK